MANNIQLTDSHGNPITPQVPMPAMTASNVSTTGGSNVQTDLNNLNTGLGNVNARIDQLDPDAATNYDMFAQLGCKPWYYHWQPNGFINNIPSQSVEDNVLAKKLGFDIVEVNHQPTATAGKYVVTHGSGGKFGAEFTSEYQNVLINSMSYADIVANVKYNSPVACYNHRISTLDDFLQSCSQLGLGVYLRGNEPALIETCRKYLSDEKIIIPGNNISLMNVRTTYGFYGMLTSYMNLSTSQFAAQMNVEYLTNYVSNMGGAPYSLVFNNNAIQYLIDEGTLDDVVGTLRKRHIYIGVCYPNTDIALRLIDAGGCGIGADYGQCNIVEGLGLTHISSMDTSGWDNISAVSVGDGKITNNSGSAVTIKTPTIGTKKWATATIHMRIKGSVNVSIGYGKTRNMDFSDSTGERNYIFRACGWNMGMIMTLVMQPNASIEYLNMDIDDLQVTGGSSSSNVFLDKFEGKKIAVIGDSISTYSGWLPSDISGYDGTQYATYYPHGTLNSVSMMWWYKVAQALNLSPQNNLSICSWSGSRVTGDSEATSTAVCGSSTRRISDLKLRFNNQAPDIIICFIGCNDWGNDVAIGDWQTSDAIPQEGTIRKFRNSYALMLDKIHATYPHARVFCCTILDDFSRDQTQGWPSNNASDVSTHTWNESIREIASALGCDVIELNRCGINYSNIKDYYSVDSGLHPNADGHTLMARKVVAELFAKY